jgi:thiol-disulfide isomerase/thioredoxin
VVQTITEDIDPRLRVVRRDEPSSYGSYPAQEQQQDAQQQQQPSAQTHRKEEVQNNRIPAVVDDEEDSDFDDDDPALEVFRQRRLAELKQTQVKHAENMAKGHGQYRTISQDEFLTECTSSDYVAIHFFHNDFERCKIMDHHLKQIALNPHHSTCKFLRINAEKSPFFVTKLKIQTLPTLIVFKDGKAVDRLTGFEGLATNSKNPDEWATSRLQMWLDTTGAIDYSKPKYDDDEDDDENEDEEDTSSKLHRLGLFSSVGRFNGYDEDI